jgi:sulfide:quinone oxidoreductase
LYSQDEADITVIDEDDIHVYQPGLLFVPFGLTQPEGIVRPRGRQLAKGASSTRPWASTAST